MAKAWQTKWRGFLVPKVLGDKIAVALSPVPRIGMPVDLGVLRHTSPFGERAAQHISLCNAQMPCHVMSRLYGLKKC